MKPDLIFILLNVLQAITVVAISYFFKKNYPKEINAFMGYRTKRSMSSPEAWILANSYSSQILFNYSVIAVILQLFLNLFLAPSVALVWTVAVWIFFLFLTIFQTEVELKKSQAKSPSK
jgi:uncharacterized membrane protein